MSEISRIIGLAALVVGVISALTMTGYLLQILDVFNQGMNVAENGGDITPYIEALVLILVAALISGWLKMLAGADI